MPDLVLHKARSGELEDCLGKPRNQCGFVSKPGTLKSGGFPLFLFKATRKTTPKNGSSQKDTHLLAFRVLWPAYAGL